MTDKLKTESGRSLPQAPTFFERHAGDRDAILAVIATLERAANTSNGDLFDSVLSEDVIWGKPQRSDCHRLGSVESDPSRPGSPVATLRI
jgi:hypothetical protein